MVLWSIQVRLQSDTEWCDHAAACHENLHAGIDEFIGITGLVTNFSKLTGVTCTQGTAKFKLSPLIFGLSVLADCFIENTDPKGLADGVMKVRPLP